MEHLIPPDADLVLNIPLSTVHLQDYWAWHYEKSSRFSVRSAYRLLAATKDQREAWLEHGPSNSNAKAVQKQWSKLWGVKVPAKLKVFAWRLARMSLPTGNVRKHREMADSDVCTICNGATDTWRHALLECNMAKCVWALMDECLVEFLAANNHEDTKLWLFELVEYVPHGEMIKILVTLWAIWWARRKVIHEQNFQSPLSTFSFIQRFLQDLEMVEGTPNRTSQLVRKPEGKWIAPILNCVKINVDGGLSRSGERGAVSAICRDATCKFMGASAVVFDGLVDPTTLEAIACSEALSLALNLNMTSIQVATDCSEVVKNIKEKNLCRYGAIVHEYIAK